VTGTLDQALTSVQRWGSGRPVPPQMTGWASPQPRLPASRFRNWSALTAYDCLHRAARLVRTPAGAPSYFRLQPRGGLRGESWARPVLSPAVVHPTFQGGNRVWAHQPTPGFAEKPRFCGWRRGRSMEVHRAGGCGAPLKRRHSCEVFGSTAAQVKVRGCGARPRREGESASHRWRPATAPLTKVANGVDAGEGGRAHCGIL